MMKIVLLKAIVFVVFFMVSCNNSPTAKENKLNQAEQDVINAKADLEQATYDSIKDFYTYKESINLKFAENKKTIATLKSTINSKSKVEKDIDEVEINRLEAKNTELQLKIQNYEQGPAQKWALFKVDFNKEVDDLGKSISAKAEQNMKK